MVTIDVGVQGGPNEEVTDPTLLQALNGAGGGNDITALARAAAAALLNINNPNISYPLTETELISSVQAAIDSGDMESLKNQLDEYNNLGCPIDQQGNPQP